MREVCEHGGAFFGAIGERFDHLERKEQVIGADVLDAWFDPAPGVIAALREHLAWLARTSPPTQGAGLVEAIAAARGVPAASVLLGSGSSDLVFRVLREWVRPNSRAVVLDPSYGEYAHLLGEVIGCAVERIALRRAGGFVLDLDELAERLRAGPELVVLVNPNSPTGRHVPRAALEAVLRGASPATRVWIDETYVDYADPTASLERFAVTTPNVFVGKSMSKAYALSGLRVGYLVGAPAEIEAMRRITPPWVVSLPAQVAAVRALADRDYYLARWRETATLRDELARGLAGAIPGVEVVPSRTNFLLVFAPADGPRIATLIDACAACDVFLRDVAGMGTTLGAQGFRVAVKDKATNQRVLEVIGERWQALVHGSAR
ncbi:MAG: histidinol-phosphate aminotransferase family protein [Planctomycetes bacterium]|nr:histidinol-phosphate aminotransferase family protein [Planctomycetota bacterium]